MTLTPSATETLTFSLTPSKSLTISVLAHTNYSSVLEPKRFVSGQEVRLRITATLMGDALERFNKTDEVGQVQLRVFVVRSAEWESSYLHNCEEHVANTEPYYTSRETGVVPELDQVTDLVGSVFFTFVAPHHDSRFIACFKHTIPMEWNADHARGWQPVYFNRFSPGGFAENPISSEIALQATESHLWYHIPDPTSMQYAMVELISLEGWNFTYAASQHCVPQPQTRYDLSMCGRGDSFKIVPRGVSCTTERTYYDGVGYFGSNYVNLDGSWVTLAADALREDATPGGMGYFGTKTANPLLDLWSSHGEYPALEEPFNSSVLRTAYVYTKIPRHAPGGRNQYDVCFSSKQQRVAVSTTNASMPAVPVWRKAYPCPYSSEDVQKCVELLQHTTSPSFRVIEERVGWSLFDFTPETWGTIIFDDSGVGALNSFPAYNGSVGHMFTPRDIDYSTDTEGYWTSPGGDYFRIVPESVTLEGSEVRGTDKKTLGSFPDTGCWDRSLDSPTGDGYGTGTGFTEGHGGLSNDGVEFPSASSDLRGDPAVARNASGNPWDNAKYLRNTFSTLWLPKADTRWRVCYRLACSHSQRELVMQGQRVDLCAQHTGMRVAVWHGGAQGQHASPTEQSPGGQQPTPGSPASSKLAFPTGAQPVKWLHNDTIGASSHSRSLAASDAVLMPQDYLHFTTTFASVEQAVRYQPISIRWYINDTRVNTFGPLLVETLNDTMSTSGYLDSRRWNYHREYHVKGKDPNGNPITLNDSVINTVGSVLRLVHKGSPCEHDGGVGSSVTRKVLKHAMDPATNLTDWLFLDGSGHLHASRLTPVRELHDGGEVECNSLSAADDRAYCMGSAKDNPTTNSIAYYIHMPDQPGEYKVCHRVKGWNWVEVPPAATGTAWLGGAGSDNTNANAMQRGEWASRSDGVASYSTADRPRYYLTLSDFLRVDGDAWDTLKVSVPPPGDISEGNEVTFLISDVLGTLTTGPRLPCERGCVSSADVLRLIRHGESCDVHPGSYDAAREDHYLSLYCRKEASNVSADTSGLLKETCNPDAMRHVRFRGGQATPGMLAAITSMSPATFDDIAPDDVPSTSASGVAAVLTVPHYISAGAAVAVGGGGGVTPAWLNPREAAGRRVGTEGDPNHYSICYKKSDTWSWVLLNNSIQVTPNTDPIRVSEPRMKGELGAKPLVSGVVMNFTLASMRAEFLDFFEAKLVRRQPLSHNSNCLGYGEGTEAQPVTRAVRYSSFANATGALSFTLTTPSIAGPYMLCLQIGVLAHYVPSSAAWSHTYDVDDNGVHWWVGASGLPSNQASVWVNFEFTRNAFNTTSDRVKLVDPADSCITGLDANTAKLAIDSRVVLVQRLQILMHLPPSEDNLPTQYRVCVLMTPGGGSGTAPSPVWMEATQLPPHLYSSLDQPVFLRTKQGLSGFVTQPSPAEQWGMEAGAPLLSGMLTVPFVSQYVNSPPSLYVVLREMPKNVSNIRIKFVAESFSCTEGVSSDLQASNTAKLYAVPSEMKVLVALHLPTTPGRFKLCMQQGSAVSPWYLLPNANTNSTVVDVMPSYLSADVNADGMTVYLFDLSTDSFGRSSAEWCGVDGYNPVVLTGAPPTSIPAATPIPPSGANASAAPPTGAPANSPAANASGSPSVWNPCLFEGYSTDLLQIQGSDELCSFPVHPPLGTLRGRPDFFQVSRVPGAREISAVQDITLPPVGSSKSAYRLCLFRLYHHPFTQEMVPRGVYHIPLFGKGNTPFWSDPSRAVSGAKPSLKVTPLFNDKIPLKTGLPAEYRVEVVGGMQAEGEMVEVMRCLDMFCTEVVPHDYVYNSKPPDLSGVRIPETEVLLYNDETDCTEPEQMELYGAPPSGLVTRLQNNEALFSLIPRSLCLGENPRCAFRFRLKVVSSFESQQGNAEIYSEVYGFSPDTSPMEQLKVNGKIVESGHSAQVACDSPSLSTCTRVVCTAGRNCTLSLRPALQGTDVYSVVQDFFGSCAVAAPGSPNRNEGEIRDLFDPRTFASNDNLKWHWNLTSAVDLSPTFYLSGSVDLALLHANALVSSHDDLIRPLLYCDFLYNTNRSSARVEILVTPDVPASFSISGISPVNPRLPAVRLPPRGSPGGAAAASAAAAATTPAGNIIHAREWYRLHAVPFDIFGVAMNKSRVADSVREFVRTRRPSWVVVAASAGDGGTPVYIRSAWPPLPYDTVEFMVDSNLGCERRAGGCLLRFRWGYGVADELRSTIHEEIGTAEVWVHVRVVGTSLRTATSSLAVAASRGIDVEVEAGERCGGTCWYADEHHAGEAFLSLTSPMSADGLQADVPFSSYVDAVSERSGKGVGEPLNRFRVVTAADDPVAVSRTLHPFAWDPALGRFVSQFTFHGSAACHGCSVEVHTTIGADLAPGRVDFTLYEGEHNLSCAAGLDGTLEVTAVNSVTGKPSLYPRWPVTITATTLNVTYGTTLGEGGFMRLRLEAGDHYIVETLPLMPVMEEGGAGQALSCTVFFEGNDTAVPDPYAPHDIVSPDMTLVSIPAEELEARIAAGGTGGSLSYLPFAGYNFEVSLEQMQAGVTLFVSINGTYVRPVDTTSEPFFVYPLGGPVPGAAGSLGAELPISSAAGGVTVLPLNSTYSHLDTENITFGKAAFNVMQKTNTPTASVLVINGSTPVREACFFLCSKERVNFTRSGAQWFVVHEHCSKVNITVKAPRWNLGVVLLKEPVQTALLPGGASCSRHATELQVGAAVFHFVEGVNSTLVRHFVYDSIVEFTLAAEGQLFEDSAAPGVGVPVVTRTTRSGAHQMHASVSFAVTGMLEVKNPQKLSVSARVLSSPVGVLPVALARTSKAYTWVQPQEAYVDFNISDSVVHTACRPASLPTAGPATERGYRVLRPQQEAHWSYLSPWAVGIPMPVQVLTVNEWGGRAWTFPHVLVRVGRHTQGGCGGSLPLRVYDRAHSGVFTPAEVVPMRQGMAVPWVSFSAPCEACTLRLDLCYTTATSAGNCLTPPQVPTAADTAPILSNRVKFTKPFSVVSPQPSGAHVTHQRLPAGAGTAVVGGGNVSVIHVGNVFAVSLEAVQHFGVRQWAAKVDGAAVEVKVVNVWRAEVGGSAALRYGNGGFLRELTPADAGEACGGVLRETNGEYRVHAVDPTLQFVYTRPCSLCEVWVHYRLSPHGSWSAFPLRTDASRHDTLRLRVKTCGIKWAVLPTTPRGRRRGEPFSVSLLHVDGMGLPSWEGAEAFTISTSGAGNGGGLLSVTGPHITHPHHGRIYAASGGSLVVSAISSRAAYSAALHFKQPLTGHKTDYFFSVMTTPTQLLLIPENNRHRRHHDSAGLMQQYEQTIDRTPKVRRWGFYIYAADDSLDRAVYPLGGPLEPQLKPTYDSLFTEGAEVTLSHTGTADVPSVIGFFDANTESNTSQWKSITVEPLSIRIAPEDAPLVLWNGMVYAAGRLRPHGPGNTTNATAPPAEAHQALPGLVHIISGEASPPGIATIQLSLLSGSTPDGTALPTRHGGHSMVVGVVDNHAYPAQVILAASVGAEGIRSVSGRRATVDLYLLTSRGGKFHRAAGSGLLETSLDCANGTTCEAASITTAGTPVLHGRGSVSVDSEGVVEDCRCAINVQYIPDGGDDSHANLLNEGQLDVPILIRSMKQLSWQWEPFPSAHTGVSHALRLFLYDTAGSPQMPVISSGPGNRIVMLTTPDNCYICAGGGYVNFGENICLPKVTSSGTLIVEGSFLTPTDGAYSVCTLRGLRGVDGVFPPYAANLVPGTAAPSVVESLRNDTLDIRSDRLVGGSGGAGEAGSIFQRVFRPQAAGSVPRLSIEGDVGVVGEAVTLTLVPYSLSIFPIFLDCGFGYSGASASEAQMLDTDVRNERHMANITEPQGLDEMTFTLHIPKPGVWQCFVKTRVFSGRGLQQTYSYRKLKTSVPLPLLVTVPRLERVEVDRFDYPSGGWLPLHSSAFSWVSGYALTLRARFFDSRGVRYLPFDIEKDRVATIRSDFIPCYHEQSEGFEHGCPVLRGSAYGWEGCGGVEGLRVHLRRVGGSDFFKPAVSTPHAHGFSGSNEEEEEDEALHHSCVDSHWGTRRFFPAVKSLRFKAPVDMPADTAAVPQLFTILTSDKGPITLPGIHLEVNKTLLNSSTGEYEYIFANNNHSTVAQGSTAYDTLMKVVHSSTDVSVSSLQLVYPPFISQVYHMELLKPYYVMMRCRGCPEPDQQIFTSQVIPDEVQANLTTDPTVYHDMYGGKGVNAFDLDLEVRTEAQEVIEQDNISELLIRARCLLEFPIIPIPTASSRFYTFPPPPAPIIRPVPLFVSESVFGSNYLQTSDRSVNGWYRVAVHDGKASLQNVTFDTECEKAVLEVSCSTDHFARYGVDPIGACSQHLKGRVFLRLLRQEEETQPPAPTLLPVPANGVVASLNITLPASGFDGFAPQEFEAKMTAELIRELDKPLYVKVRYLCRFPAGAFGFITGQDRLNTSVCRAFGGGSVGGTRGAVVQAASGMSYQLEFEIVGDSLDAAPLRVALQSVVSSETSSIRKGFPGLSTQLNITSVPVTHPPTPTPPTHAPGTPLPILTGPADPTNSPFFVLNITVPDGGAAVAPSCSIFTAVLYAVTLCVAVGLL